MHSSQIFQTGTMSGRHSYSRRPGGAFAKLSIKQRRVTNAGRCLASKMTGPPSEWTSDKC